MEHRGTTFKRTYPDFFMKRKELSNNKTAVIFRRNNLSFKDFERYNNTYYYIEDFNYNGISGVIHIELLSNNLYDLFEVTTKKIKIRGQRWHLGIYLRFPSIEKYPFETHGTVKKVKYHFICYKCKYVKLERTNTNTFKGKRKKKGKSYSVSRGGRINRGIYATNAYHFFHPYQGGSCSPR